jgi:dihydrofolate reductase
MDGEQCLLALSACPEDFGVHEGVPSPKPKRMRKIVYYVAASLDGYIAGPGEDISGFVGGGNGIDKYRNDLLAYDTVIMGRNTYEFGYKFGLKPGSPAYPHMKHYIFSNSLQLPVREANIFIKAVDLREVQAIREQPGPDIYLCGGGRFAGWLLDHQQIDILKIKLNPLILGGGVKLFGASQKQYKTALEDTATYENGLQIMTYKLLY